MGEKLLFKEQILKSKRYKARRDLLNVLLEDNKQYTHNEIQQLLDSFLKKEVM